MTFSWAFLSGIEANDTGTGRFMQHLQSAILRRGKFDGTIFYAPAAKGGLQSDLIAALLEIPHLVIFHPQMLGAEPTLRLMRQRGETGRRTHLYMLDNFFFCIRSYNHIDAETGPCFRCVGSGESQNATRMGCRPWPASDAASEQFVSGLATLVQQGTVQLFAQNPGQVEIARRHFGVNAQISYVGLWCADWTGYVDAFAASGRAEGDMTTERPEYDIVYHGSRDLAKGIGWTLALAEQTPELRYLVPIDRGQVNVKAPANVTVASMRWEGGLHDAVRSARLVLSPSLWSSPCEGALIKNIVVAKAAGVVDIPSAFSAEVPASVVTRFPQDLRAAGPAVRDALALNWRPDPAAREAWVAKFRAFNEGVAERLLPSSGQG